MTRLYFTKLTQTVGSLARQVAHAGEVGSRLAEIDFIASETRARAQRLP